MNMGYPVPDTRKEWFKDGRPIRVKSRETGREETDALALFNFLNDLGRKHGIGRIDIVENRFVGIKSRGIYETPGGTILFVAHQDIEGIAMDAVMFAQYAPDRMALYAFAAIIMTVLASAWPAFRVSRMRPIEAIHHQ